MMFLQIKFVIVTTKQWKIFTKHYVSRTELSFLIIQNIQRLTHTRCSSKKVQINYILKPTKFQNGFGCLCWIKCNTDLQYQEENISLTFFSGVGEVFH